jgi:hypothetical protein
MSTATAMRKSEIAELVESSKPLHTNTLCMVEILVI